MNLAITILILIASVLLILFVLVQNSKGGGLASGFSSSNQIMGVRKTTDFLEKTTWFLAGTIIILSIVSARYSSSSATENKSQIELQDVAPLNPNVAPDVAPELPINPTAE